MAAISAIARECANEIRDGIAWVIIWKIGRSWNAQAVWLDSDTDTFEPEDLDLVREILKKDPKAIMVNGYYCGHFGEDMTVSELAAGIRWHYENGYNTLEDSTAFPPESMELRSPPSMELMLTITPDTAVAILEALQPAALRFFEALINAAREAWAWLKRAAKEAGRIVARIAGRCMDAMLYQANDNPKWWHYYKHAKKWRVRKKYRRRLERQLCDKLLAAATG